MKNIFSSKVNIQAGILKQKIIFNLIVKIQVYDWYGRKGRADYELVIIV